MAQRGRHARAAAPFASIFNTQQQQKQQKQQKLPDDVLARLADVPVFYVSDGKTAITVRGDETAETCLLFLDMQAARAYLQETQRLSGDDNTFQLGAMSLEAAVRAREQHTDLTFRFVPALQEVQAALALYKEAGVQLAMMSGVPVFQADGMYVEHGGGKYSPIFFSKADLDAALGAAHSSQQDAQRNTYLKKADKAKGTYDAECDKFAKAGNEKAKAAARKRLEKAQEDEASWREKARQIAEAELPKVEVSCLEDVVSAIKADTTGQWKEALFVPPGGATYDAPAEQKS